MTKNLRTIQSAQKNRDLIKYKALYTAESVACDWAGAVMQKLPQKRRKN